MTTARNEHTGDALRSKLGNTDAYAKGYDLIFNPSSQRSDAPETPCHPTPPPSTPE